MPELDFINSFLGLQSYEVIEWKRYRKSWIELWVQPQSSRYRCSKCGKELSGYYDRRWVRLQDLTISTHTVYLWVPRYRVECSPCGVQPVQLTIARRYARCTRRFERELFQLTKDMTVKAVAERMDVDWRTVKEAEKHYIAGSLRKRNLDDIRVLGIDEVSEKKGHHYLTLVTDIIGRRVIWVGRGRDRAVLNRFFRWFGPERTRRLRSVVIDMHDPYQLAIQAHCPDARVIYDHFHVVKPLHLAIDNIRRRLQNQAPPEDRRYLKNSRYLLLRARENLTQRQQVQLQELLAVNQTLNAAYILKEDLRTVFRMLPTKEARAELREWKQRVRESDIPELVEYLAMLNRRRYGILNFFRHRQTNGLSEGLNNVVKTIKKQAYGFHDWQYFRLKILRQCGKLEGP